MVKIACATLLIAASLQGQTAPATQATAPARPEAASQSQAQPPTAGTLLQERAIAIEAVKKLLDPDSFDSKKLHFTTAKPTQCAIPLQVIPVPDKEDFASKTVPANPSIDPKIISPPLLPPCPQDASPLTIIEKELKIRPVPNSKQEKKADRPEPR